MENEILVSYFTRQHKLYKKKMSPRDPIFLDDATRLVL